MPILKFLEKIDIFTIPISFHIEKHTHYSTMVSKLSSIMVLGMLIFGFSVYIKEVVLKDHPTILELEFHDGTHTPVDFSPNNKLLAIGLED
jgi:hypothetical protein